MNTTDATLTNGGYELPGHPRRVLVLADPPEAGWRLEFPPDAESHPERNRLPAADSAGSLVGESDDRISATPS